MTNPQTDGSPRSTNEIVNNLFERIRNIGGGGVSREEVQQLVYSEVGKSETVKNAAAAAVNEVIDDANIIRGEDRELDEFTVRFGDSEPFLRANEVDGITSRVGGSLFTPLPAESGWLWAIMGKDRRVDLGRRTDGTLYGAASSNEEPVSDVGFPIIQVGDSLTAGWMNANALTLPGNLFPVENIGIGGQTSPQIVARYGSKPALLTVTGNKIPASGPVNVTAWSTNLFQRTADGATWSQVGMLAGVKGTLFGRRVTSTQQEYTFTRLTSGDAVHCPANSPFQCGEEYRHRVPIIAIGRNNFKQDDPAVIIDHIRRSLEWTTRRDKAVVLSILPFTGEEVGGSLRPRLDVANSAIRDAFPERWVDWAGYLCSEDALRAVGITPTATDLQNITDGMTPESFRSDAGHLNAKGYEASNKMIYNYYAAKGWL